MRKLEGIESRERGQHGNGRKTWNRTAYSSAAAVMPVYAEEQQEMRLKKQGTHREVSRDMLASLG